MIRLKGITSWGSLSVCVAKCVSENQTLRVTEVRDLTEGRIPVEGNPNEGEFEVPGEFGRDYLMCVVVVTNLTTFPITGPLNDDYYNDFSPQADNYCLDYAVRGHFKGD
jgi:hypothetical protein